MSRPARTFTQSSDRAELRGLTQAFETAARQDTRILVHLDNEAVAIQVQEIIDASEEEREVPTRHKHGDLYSRVEKCIKDKGKGFYRVKWVKGHQKEAIEGEEREFHGNSEADKAARQAVERHKDWKYVLTKHKEQKQRNKEAARYQSMLVLIWQERKKQLEDKKAKEVKVEEKEGDHNEGSEEHQTAQERFPHYGWEPKRCGVEKVEAIQVKGRKGSIARWKHNLVTLEAIKWYYSQLRWIKQEKGNDATKAVAWEEMYVDFEIATGLTISKGDFQCRVRAFARASQATATICGRKLWKGDFSKVATLRPLGGKTASGVDRRPIFMWGNKVGEVLIRQIQEKEGAEAMACVKPLLKLYSKKLQSEIKDKGWVPKKRLRSKTAPPWSKQEEEEEQQQEEGVPRVRLRGKQTIQQSAEAIRQEYKKAASSIPLGLTLNNYM